MSKVLLIETDPWLADNVCRLLKTYGHKVKWCVDLQSAVNAADQQKIDIIILDLLLAGRSGVEFLYELRSYSDWLDLPIVLFSNISSEDLGQSVNGFEQLDIAAYHYKPTTSLNELAKSIDHVLNTRTPVT